MAKDSLLKGTLILSVAALVARVLGIAQRVPLVYLLGTAGSVMFAQANNVYLMLLPLATAGIPSALSKLVSEKIALGQREQAEHIYRASIRFAIIAGIVITVPMFIAAPYYADYVKVQGSALSIRAIAPALLLFPVIAMMRGYFQGRQMMMAGGISQIVEQFARVATSVGFAAIFLWAGSGEDWIAAGASFGGVMGAVGAFAVMMYYMRKLRRSDYAALRETAAASESVKASGLPAMSTKAIYKALLSLSIPIVIFSSAVAIVYFIDSFAIRLIESQVGLEMATKQYGWLAYQAQSLAGIPVIFATAISQSLVPVISSAFAGRDMAEVGRKASLALRLAVLSGLPVILVICTAAAPINALLFTSSDGWELTTLLTAGTIFQILMMTSGAILMGMGRMKPLVGFVLAGIAVKIVGTVVLSQWFGMYGVVAATALCFITASTLNIAYLRKEVPFTILGSRWPGLIASILVISAVGGGAAYFGLEWLQPFGQLKLDALLQTLVVGGLAGALYPFMLMATRVVTKEDIATFPAPIRKLIGKVQRLLGR
ncbi:oligosaccharide flippase family protein [Paenibacillus sp. MBLB4367]|uniref:putative polysaccharide biosynthesis protein n=1 Tax=Paenibacillus sp. MBLB4367 TaxID=3384767 RepID=UPI003907EA44